VRILLVVTTLALVFAPGLLADATEPATPGAVTATVLAPSDDHVAKPTAARARDIGAPLLLAALLVAAVAIAPLPSLASLRRREPCRARRVAPSTSPLSRRGPPALVA
jgi:hypothetical protein